MYIQGHAFNFWAHLSSCALPDFVYTDSGCVYVCVCVDQSRDASLSKMFQRGDVEGRGLTPWHQHLHPAVFPAISSCSITDLRINIQGLFMTSRVCGGVCKEWSVKQQETPLPPAAWRTAAISSICTCEQVINDEVHRELLPARTQRQQFLPERGWVYLALS